MLPSRKLIGLACFAAAVGALSGASLAEDRLLKQTVEFNGAITFLATKVPGFLLVAVRNGETAIAGFGDIADKRGKTPDGDTVFRIGSISKVFCGEALASAVLDGKLHFEDRLQDRLGYDVQLPEQAGRPIRIIDLVTQSSGLPREVPRQDGPPDDPFANNTKETQIADLKSRSAAVSAGNGDVLFQLRLRSARRRLGEYGGKALFRTVAAAGSRSRRHERHRLQPASRR